MYLYNIKLSQEKLYYFIWMNTSILLSLDTGGSAPSKLLPTVCLTTKMTAGTATNLVFHSQFIGWKFSTFLLSFSHLAVFEF